MSQAKRLGYLELWPDDVIARKAVRGESCAVWGARMLLWCFSVYEDPPGTLPADDAKLARILGVKPSAWRRVAGAVTSDWERQGERWVVRRIMQQVEKREAIRVKRARAARTRWDAATDASAKQSTSTCSTGAMPSVPVPVPVPDSAPVPVQKSPPAKPAGAPSDSENWQLDLARAQQNYPAHWWKLEQLFRRFAREGKPPEVMRQVLAALARGDAKDPVALAVSILKVEEPNFHERAAIEEHARLKAEDAAAHAPGQFVRVNRGMQAIGDVLRNLGGAKP